MATTCRSKHLLASAFHMLHLTLQHCTQMEDISMYTHLHCICFPYSISNVLILFTDGRHIYVHASALNLTSTVHAELEDCNLWASGMYVCASFNISDMYDIICCICYTIYQVWYIWHVRYYTYMIQCIRHIYLTCTILPVIYITQCIRYDISDMYDIIRYDMYYVLYNVSDMRYLTCTIWHVIYITKYIRYIYLWHVRVCMSVATASVRLSLHVAPVTCVRMTSACVCTCKHRYCTWLAPPIHRTLSAYHKHTFQSS